MRHRGDIQLLGLRLGLLVLNRHWWRGLCMLLLRKRRVSGRMMGHLRTLYRLWYRLRGMRRLGMW